jgi:chemotaxis protein MotB
MNLRSIAVVAACASLPAIGCVTKAQYDTDIQSANTARDQARAELARERARLQDTEKGRASMQAAMQKELDDATAVDEQLQAELKRLGENAESLLATNGSLKGALERSQRRLEELRRAQAAAEARAALFADLARKLKSMIDAGDLAIILRDGRMVLRLSNDILFDSGRADLKPEGKRALAEIADVLRTIPGRDFQVAGHTDNEPIRYSHFRSNWDLSTTRALSVVNFLISSGLSANTLSAAGFGEFDPIDTNDTSSGKSHNRRTEITLQPNIDEIIAVPDGE